MNHRRIALLFSVLLVCACPLRAADAPSKEDHKDDKAKWQSLFDGKDLGHWKPTEFGGQGEVKVEDGQLILSRGDSLTGVTWQGEVPPR